MRIYFTEEKNLCTVEEPLKGCWISLIHPTDEEIHTVSDRCSVPEDMLRAALDPEERSRIDSDDGCVMILVNVPVVTETQQELYDTVPLAIILTDESVITVCSRNSPVLRAFAEGHVPNFTTAMKTRFVFQILYAAASLFLGYLRKIEKHSEAIEDRMRRAADNRQLFELLRLQKTLVYFSTSLRANEAVLEKLMRTDAVKKYPEDAEILEDAIIENRQAMEMTQIYREIVKGTTDTFASVISNNLNLIMKTLAIITIVMAIPTIIFSAYGMNVSAASMPLAMHSQAFLLIIVLALLCSLVVGLVFLFSGRFRR